jgi:hypothetical protein
MPKNLPGHCSGVECQFTTIDIMRANYYMCLPIIGLAGQICMRGWVGYIYIIHPIARYHALLPRET